MNVAILEDEQGRITEPTPNHDQTFSQKINEAGIGSAAIAHSASKNDEPVSEVEGLRNRLLGETRYLEEDVEATGNFEELVWHFVRRHQLRLNKNIRRIPNDITKAMMNYGWPGNVRELSNVIERAVILTRGDALTVDEAFTRTLVPAPPDWRLSLNLRRRNTVEEKGKVLTVDETTA